MRILIFLIFIFFISACVNKSHTKDIAKTKTMFDTLTAFVNIKYPSGLIKESGLLSRGEKSGVWKEFDKNGKLVSVKYYNGKNAILLDKEDYNFSKITVDNISINLPSNWTIKKNYKTSLIIAVKSGAAEINFSPTIVIRKTVLTKKMDFVEIVNANKQDMLNNMDDLVIEEENDLIIANNKAYQMLYSVNYNNQRKSVLVTIMLNENTLYNITCIADSKDEEFAKYRALYKEVTNGFEISSSQSN